MRKDIFINVNSENNKVKIDNKTLGITSENLQGKIIFKPEPFVDGVCRLYVDGKGSILMDKDDDCYTVNILSSLLTEDSLDICFKITEPETDDGIPIFCSKIMHFRVLETIDSSSTIPEDYPSWEQVLDSMMAKVEQMESDAEDRLDEVVGQIQDLTSAYNSNATNKTNEFNTNATNKTTAFNQNYASKVTEIDGAVNSAKTELDDYTEDKKDEIDGSVDDLKSELDTYETAKEGELDSHTSTKKTELNTYTNSKKSDLDDYEETKETALNTLAGNLTSAFNSNANSKTSDFNDNATSKTTSFNENATSKTGDFNTNATNKTTDFNTNATNKTSEFDQNAEDKTDDFDDNASEKTTAFNNNATAKIAEYDAHVAELQSQVDDLTTLVETELESNSVEGTEIDVSDSAEYRGRIEVKGNTYQKQLSGKNLWGGFSYSRTASGVTHIYNKDGTFIVNGTATANSDSLMSSTSISEGIYRTFPAGTYTVSGGTAEVQLYAVKTSGEVIANTSSTTFSKSFTLTVETNLFIRTRVNAGVTVNNATVYCMVESGSTTTDFEPYCGGQAPNPDYPQNIEVVTGDNVIKHVGKNLLNIYTIVKGRLDNGVIGYVSDTSELTKNENNFSFTTTTGYRGVTSDYIKINNENIFVFSSTTSNNNYNISVACYDQNKNYLRQATINALTNNSRSIEILDDTKYIRIYFYLSNAGSITIDKPQLEEGSTATSYEPYRGESFEVNLGKNLFNKSTITSGSYIGTDGSISSNENTFYSDYIEVKPNTVYAISGKNNSWTNTALYDRNKNFISRISDTNFTTTSTTYYIRTNGKLENLDTIQIEKGATATSYSEYFTPIELCKIDDYQDILFKNEVGDENYNSSLVEGAWYKKGVIGKDILNGTEDGWEVKDTSQQGKSRWILPITNIKYVSRTNEIGCIIASHYKAIAYAGGSGTYNNVQGISVANNWDRIGIYDNTYNTDLAQFKAWLATHNIELYYALLTPTYTQITNPTLISQLEALRKAKWYKGVNHWWTETENLEPNLKGTYKQSNNLRLQALEQAVVALGGV